MPPSRPLSLAPLLPLPFSLAPFLALALLQPAVAARPAAAPAPTNGIPCRYQLPLEANVTLAVFDARGQLVRTLLKDVRRPAGSNSAAWDGADQYGKPVVPGDYHLRGISHPPIGVQPVVSIGNPGRPPWPTADGRGDWLSDEAAPQAAVTDGTTLYLAAPGCEKGFAVIAVGPDGRRLWGYSQASSYPRCVSLALQGRYLYALYSGPEAQERLRGPNQADKIGRAYLLCLDRTTGVPALFSTRTPNFTVTTWPYVDRVAGLWDLRRTQSFTPANYEGQTRYFANDVGEPTEAVGIAAAGGRLYVSMLTQNRLLEFDAATAAPLGELPLPQPVGLHAQPDGTLLAISQGRVVQVNPATGAIAPLIEHDLAAPHDVTTDAVGRLYVSDWGPSFQVKVFSPQGRLLRAIGVHGGRPWLGRWNPNGMLLPRGIAVTSSGVLWVAEDDSSPNRISCWNAATGAFLRDYIGPAPYGGGANFWVDPTNPSTVLAEGTIFHVDYLRKTWTPIATPFRRLSLGGVFTPNGMFPGEPGSRTVTHAGRQYVYCNISNYEMVVLRRDGLRLTPVAAIGCRGRLITDDGTQEQIWDSDIGSHRIRGYFPPYFAGHAGDDYLWTDRNGDGQVQPDEVQWVHTLNRGENYVPGRLPEFCVGWGYGVGPDGTLYPSGFCRDRNVVVRVDLQGWSPTGIPEYKLATARTLLVTPNSEPVQAVYVDDARRIFITRAYEWTKSPRALDCYTPNGQLRWSFAAPAGQQQPDDFLADSVLAAFHEPGGEEILASWLWHANYKPYLFTADGLYLGSLLNDSRLGPTATWDESYKNYFQAPDGTAYIVNGANDAYHINRITGLTQLHRFEGVLHVSAAAIARAQDASRRAAAAPPPPPQPVLHVAWRTAPHIDGDLSDWNMDAGVSLQGSRGRSAQVALARDTSTLYLAYEVRGARFVNRGGSWQTLFISGDAVDLMLHVGPDAPHFAPAAGDERLLLSLYQGQPIAVLYRPVVPGAAAPTRLMAATIDQVIRLRSARIAFRRTAGGYTLEAAVPLSDLGISAAAADPLRGDAGVIFADETGTNRSLRLYYYNHDTAITADLTTEATLQPGSWGELDLPLGPNLLKNGDFEQPLAASPDAGWAVIGARGGATAALDAGAHAGSHALLFQQTNPVTFSPESYALPDYDTFIRSANGGKGGGFAEVAQRVPVTPGKHYTLRFHLRALDFPGGENKQPGPNRGYVSFQCWARWDGGGNLWVINRQDDTPQWLTLTNARWNYYSVPVPYTAPAGAHSMLLTFSLVNNYANRLPRAYLDDVEFVEAP